jgi:hypothetical protein
MDKPCFIKRLVSFLILYVYDILLIENDISLL